MPIISKELSDELEKNVLNIFDKGDQFRAMGQAICRKIILSGGPGNGKTMIERFLASRLRGKVTTIWVSAKSIEHREHIDDIFEIARKLSPALVIMEDLDLISGTRSHFGNESMLGELLNQLDGLKKNDAIVIVASTNCVADLDEALNDRPERFDRIFEVGKPTSDLAQEIATQYLLNKCNVPEATIKSLNLAKYFKDQEFSGAQIVEVIRGAIFEAIHRGLGSDINEQCLKASKDGLLKQRDLIAKKSK
jgi:SpoVK/Ycf46/Vps4 family AAA+-type ATPase